MLALHAQYTEKGERKNKQENNSDRAVYNVYRAQMNVFLHEGYEIVTECMYEGKGMMKEGAANTELSLDRYENATTKALGMNARRSYRKAVSERKQAESGMKKHNNKITIVHIMTWRSSPGPFRD